MNEEVVLNTSIWEEIPSDPKRLSSSRSTIQGITAKVLKGWRGSDDDLEVGIKGVPVPKKAGALALGKAIEEGEIVVVVNEGQTGLAFHVGAKEAVSENSMTIDEGRIIFVTFPEDFIDFVESRSAREEKVEEALIAALSADIELGRENRGRIKGPQEGNLVRIFKRARV